MQHTCCICFFCQMRMGVCKCIGVLLSTHLRMLLWSSSNSFAAFAITSGCKQVSLEFSCVQIEALSLTSHDVRTRSVQWVLQTQSAVCSVLIDLSFRAEKKSWAFSGFFFHLRRCFTLSYFSIGFLSSLALAIDCILLDWSFAYIHESFVSIEDVEAISISFSFLSE